MDLHLIRCCSRKDVFSDGTHNVGEKRVRVELKGLDHMAIWKSFHIALQTIKRVDVCLLKTCFFI